MNLYQSITENLRQDISAGVLSPGDKIPSISELREKHGVSHITIMRVYRELAAANLVVCKSGQGYYVSDNTPKPTSICGRLGCFVRSFRKAGSVDNYYNEINIGIQLAAGAWRTDLLQPHATAGLNTKMLSEEILEDLQRAMLNSAPLVDGYLIDERIPDNILEEVIRQTGKPMVVINRESSLPVNAVINDNEASIRIILETAMRMGYSEFVFCASGKMLIANYNAEERLKIFTRLVGTKHRAIIDNGSSQPRPGYLREVEKCYNERRKFGKVLLFGSDAIAWELVTHFFPEKRPLDSDLGIAGLEGLAVSKTAATSISTTRINTYDIGSTAVEKLLDLINNTMDGSPKTYRLEPTLELGESM